jgi:hypothetical protein
LTLLIDGLPGYPDNLEFDEETGLIWIALALAALACRSRACIPTRS